MIFALGVYLTLSLPVLIFTLLFAYYWTVVRKTSGFPRYHALLYIIHQAMTRKTPESLPFTNFLFQILEDMNQKHAKEGFCATYNAKPTLFLFCKEPFKILLNEKAATNKSPEYKILSEGLGPGLVTSNGERWKKHRKLLNPAFQLGMLKDKVPLLNEHASILIEDLKALEGKVSTDHLNIIKRHYFNSLSECIFGVKQTGENKRELIKYFHHVDKIKYVTQYRAFQPWLWPKFTLKYLPYGRKYLEMYEDVYNIVKNVILEMKNHVSLNNESYNTEYFSENLQKSFAYILLQHHLKNPSFTFNDVHGHVNTFMIAGYDTVSYTTMWCLFLLGLHPEIQEKVFEEVQSTTCITFEEIKDFIYLEAVIMETLRLYPTIPIFSRSLGQDVQLGKDKVYKGTTLVFSVYHSHRNPDNFPDPEKFDPDRFLRDEEREPSSYIPFAEGNRSCIGKTFALIEMKMFLAYILRNFKVTSLDKPEDIRLCINTVLVPAKPLRLLMSHRDKTL